MLRACPLGEADRIVTLFTLDRGKVDAVAKGVRRARSHFAGRLEFANECELLMHRGRSLDVIVSAEISRTPWERMVEPERYAVASLVAELVDAFCEPEMALADVYELLIGALEAIARSNAPRALLPRFSLRLLEMLGIGPPLFDCVRCGAPLRETPVWLDAESGGVIDRGCRERWRELPELEGADLENLRALARPRNDGAALHATPAAAKAVEELVAHHLGRRLRRRRTSTAWEPNTAMIMALDVGSKRIGIAVADPSESFALPVGTVQRSNKRTDLAQLREYFDSYGVDELVVGDPLTLRGERGVAAQAMDGFVEELRAVFTGTIHRFDERLTTAQATKTLVAADVSRRKRRDVVDKMAAALILESFLTRRRHGTLS